MGKHDKLLSRILAGTSDASIAFNDLCAMLRHRGFSMRCKRTSHHIFSHPNADGIINLQPTTGGQAKKYQVQEVRKFLVKNKLT